MTEYSNRLKCELYNDSMQNWKSKPIQKAQLIIADVPYNVGTNFYGSNPVWYKGGDNKNGESKLAGKEYPCICYAKKPAMLIKPNETDVRDGLCPLIDLTDDGK